jgi:poly(A) polymerase
MDKYLIRMDSQKMNMDIKNQTKELFRSINRTAEKAGMDIYVVGGFIRDLLLDIEGKDIDFVVIGDAISFVKEYSRKHKTSKLVLYPKFGTCMIEYKGYKLEFATAREESYRRSSRKPDVKSANLNIDLSRRDFTINTMAMDISDDNFLAIIDPYHGQRDLQEKIIKTPLNPIQTFSDDPLRMIRAIRFATSLSFDIEKNTYNAMKKVADRLKIISQERITDEFNKILLSARPSIGVKLLDECNLLKIFFPELVKTKGVEQRNDFHHKDVFYHTLQVVDQVQTKNTDSKLKIRLTALLHDIGKPQTKQFSKKSGWTFHGHDVVAERMSETILRRLKYSKEIIDYVKKLVRLHLRPMALVSEDVTNSAIRRLLFAAGNEFDDLMILCRADITSKNPIKIKQYLKNYKIVIKKAKSVEKKDRLRAFKSPVDGREIMQIFNLPPGPQIGKIKKYIEESILDGKIPNEHDAALKYLMENKEKVIDSVTEDKKLMKKTKK